MSEDLIRGLLRYVSVSEAAKQPPPHSSVSVTDGELMMRARASDSRALEELYDRHAGFVLAMSLRILKERGAAEEVVQDVFWQLWKGSIRYDPARGSFTTWLYSIARNRAIDHLRRSRPHAVALFGSSMKPAPDDPERAAYQSEQHHHVRRALSALPEEQRRAIELSFFDGLTHGEISEVLKQPLGTVKSRIRLAIEKLRVTLRGTL